MKPDRILLGVLKNSNLEEYFALKMEDNNQVILFSYLDLDQLGKENIRQIETSAKNITLVFNKHDIKSVLRYKYDPEMISITNWFIYQPEKLVIHLADGSQLYASNTLDVKHYNGNYGYGIGMHSDNVDIKYFGYGASINSIDNRLLSWIFDGKGIKRYDY